MKLADLAPSYLGAQNIVLTQNDPPTTVFFTGSPIGFSVGVQNEAVDSGLMLPMRLTITAPDGSMTTKTYSTVIPLGFAFTPRVGGTYLIVLAEITHNFWRGSLQVQVVGDPPDDS